MTEGNIHEAELFALGGLCDKLTRERDDLRAENAELREEAKLFNKIVTHLSQLLYDSEGNPLDGWEEWAGAEDTGELREFADRFFCDPPGEERR